MILEDTVVVIAPLSGGPSEAVGLLAGDKIVQIEDTIVAGVGFGTRNIMNLLRGEKGTEVTVGIMRDNKPELLEFTITRDKIPVHSMEIAKMLDEKNAYMRFNRFSASTYEEFITALKDLAGEQAMKNLILDLRQNPGGYLQQATRMLSQFFQEQDELLVYTEGRTVSRSDYKSSGRAFYEIDKIVVLIDEGAASASEIVAGAIQDHDRGIIIGRRSFGKGLVQEQYNLRDGSALRLTVARYYTPSGRCIQKPYDDPDTYDQDVFDRFHNGELSAKGNTTVTDSTKYYTEGGHIVYAGGGIYPDVFVPLDSLAFNSYYLAVRQHIPGFVFRYMENGGSKLNYSLVQFLDQFQVDEALLNEFLTYCQSKEVEFEKEQYLLSQKEIKRSLKSRIGKHLFDDEGFYGEWLKEDEMVNKALDVLKSPNPLASFRQ